MSIHLSNLVLDELASGLSNDGEAKAHAEECAECQVRLEAIFNAREKTFVAPQFERIRANLHNVSIAESRKPEKQPAAESFFQRFKWAFALSPVLAAALWVVVMALRAPEPEPTSRLKGNASIRVLHQLDGTPMTSARPGDRVVLTVASAGLDFGFVLAVDAERNISALWPSDSPVSERLPTGADVHLEPGFEVTPGTIVLHGFFSSKPLPLSTVRAQLQKELEAEAQAGTKPAPLEGVVRAAKVLTVEP